MADDNRPLKYMRYAVGEIALVVIGILIALSINNWNEERQERKVRDSYYLSIINSFDKDLQEIQDYSNYIEASEKNINEFKSKVKNVESYKEASQYFTSFNFLTTDCDLNASIWESLVNSGDIGLLDEDIKSSLLDFEESILITMNLTRICKSQFPISEQNPLESAHACRTFSCRPGYSRRSAGVVD